MANKLLAMVMLYPAFAIAMNIIFLLLNLHNLVFLNCVNIATSLIFVPVLLAYLRLLQGRLIEWKGKFILHFIPSIVIFFSSIRYIIMDEQERMNSLNLILKGEENYVNFINLLLLVHVLTYLYIAKKEIKRHAVSVLNFYSSIEEVQIEWMNSIVHCLIWLKAILLLAYLIPLIVVEKAHIYSDRCSSCFCRALRIYALLIMQSMTSPPICGLWKI